MKAPERLAPSDLRAALAYVLASPGVEALSSREQVARFCDYLTQCPVRWEGLRCGRRSAPTGLFFVLLIPGGTAIAMLPAPGEHGIDPDHQRQVMIAGLARLAGRGLHYMQALVEPEAAAKRALLEQLGFRRLAPLVYLERDVLHPWVDPPAPGQIEWVRYSPQTHAEFATTVLATYHDSQDCPELTGLRPIEDILVAHQASGRFDPGLWELARVGGRVAGCLLLSRLTHGPMLEVVYMGVVPGCRRQGLGSLLLRRALEQCRTAGARRLTVVVDDRNQPAKRLYANFGLEPVARRDAYLYRWEAV
jgi:GNAT superfamily N-acetyltransferase